METVTLNNGLEMPALGLGVFQTPPDETRDAVRAALDRMEWPGSPGAR
jgi:diketogulonate reductase-like aldo/keto reductase